MKFETGPDFAKKLDSEDELATYREKFYIPKMENGEDVIYLCGNSLGLQPREVPGQIEKELESWKTNGVEGHFKETKWVSFHEEPSELLQDIVGANEKEIIVMNTLTVNLHLLMVSFYRPTKDRFKVLVEKKAFPSDQYAVKSQISFHGHDPKEAFIELTASSDDGIISLEDIETTFEQHGNQIALVMIGGVNYYTGQVFDMKKITEIGHKYGCIVGFDLAHAAGNVKLQLHDWEVDFAVWCTYKYLNSGPGAIAAAFIHQKHLESKDLPRFAGWWGHDKSVRFLMEPEFVPMKSAEAWQISNVPVFSMAPLKISFKIFNEVGMDKLIQKSKLLTGYLQYLVEQLETDNVWITPTDPMIRGCQLSLHVKNEGKQLYDDLTRSGVICDWREPDVIRIAPVPLYNSFEDVYKFYKIIKEKVEGNK